MRFVDGGEVMFLFCCRLFTACFLTQHGAPLSLLRVLRYVGTVHVESKKFVCRRLCDGGFI